MMEDILDDVVMKKGTGSYFVQRDGTNSDRCVVESTAINCGCELTDWHEHDCGSVVMDFDAQHGHFIIIAK